MKTMRLDKYLAWATGITRNEAKNDLKKGKVTVDGIVAKKPEMKIDVESAMVAVDGKPCKYEEYVYIMLHKPQGVVSATEDDREKTVMDLIENPCRGLFPVGRLDKDTEGLLLLTNDGALAHRLLSPGKHVDKCYYALLDGPVGEREQKMFEEGLDIGDQKRTLPAKLDWNRNLGQSMEQTERTGQKDQINQTRQTGQTDQVEQTAKLEQARQKVESKSQVGEPVLDGSFGVYITIQEGRFHQIKWMAEAIGRRVLYLKRMSMGSLALDERLLPGQYRLLTEEEIMLLREMR